MRSKYPFDDPIGLQPLHTLTNGDTFMKLLPNNGAILVTKGFSAVAAELMSPHPLSINDEASVREAAAFLTRKRIGAAPVIDEAGRPVGVISLSDIARHDYGDDASAPVNPSIKVRDIMTPGVLFVRPDTSIRTVVDDLLKFGVHRLFVLDSNNILIGVISTFDVLRHVRYMRTTRLHPHPDF
jgi:predicted transcriptional regulator